MASSAAITGVSVIAVAAPAHASTAGSAHVRIIPAAHELTRAASSKKTAPPIVTVTPGDTLSGIARARCGSGASWRAIYDANRSTVKNPGLIYPGQVLVLNCSSAQLSAARITSDPSRDRFDGKKGPCGDGDHDGFDAQCWEVGLASVPMPAHVSITRTTVSQSSGKIWGVTYGNPNLCGDGDGDGWDVNCQSRAADPPAHVAAVTAVSYSRNLGGNVNPGSYSGFQACVIARESGGNSQVMNSTGHYGLYQFSASTWAVYGGSPAAFGHASVAQQNQVFAAAMASPGGRSNWSPYDGCL